MVEDKVSKRIKSTLKDLGLKQAHLATKLGMKPQVLSRLLISGASKSRYLTKIAQALDVTEEYLRDGNAKPVYLMDDLNLKKLILAKFKFTTQEDIDFVTKDLMIKSDKKGLYIGYELQIALDETMEVGTIVVFSTNMPKRKKQGEIYMVLSSVSQSFIIGKYSEEKLCLVNLKGSYAIQSNDQLIGVAIQMLVYVNEN